MADEANTEVAAETSGDNPTEQEREAENTQPETDWEAKAQAQQKVNRDLERKLAEARKSLDRLSDMEAELAKLQGKESEYQAAQEAQRLKDEALAAANERILKAEVRAQAAGKFNDPADALRFLDLSEFEVDSDGNVKGDLGSALDDLLASKPYLSAQGKRFQGTADGGARNEGTARPSQLTESDLLRMSAEQIEAARKEGRLNDLLGIK